jgi:hypothetical protein
MNISKFFPLLLTIATLSTVAKGSVTGTHLGIFEEEVTQLVKIIDLNEMDEPEVIDVEETINPKFFAELTFNKKGFFTGVVGVDNMIFRVRGRIPDGDPVIIAEGSHEIGHFSASLEREEAGSLLYTASYTRNYAEATSITASGSTQLIPAATRGVDISGYTSVNLTSRRFGFCAVATIRPNATVRVTYINEYGLYPPLPPRIGRFYIDENQDLVALLIGPRWSGWPGKVTISRMSGNGICIAEDAWLGLKGSNYRTDVTGSRSPTHFVYFNNIFDTITIPIPEWPLSGSYALMGSNGVPVRITVNPRTGYLRGQLAPHSLSVWTDHGTEIRQYPAQNFHGYIFTEGALMSYDYENEIPVFGGFRGVNFRSQKIYSFFMGFHLWDLSDL